MNKPTRQSMSYDDLGDRMKAYEGRETNRQLMPYLPTLARIDGRAFHMFTRNLPVYSTGLRACMLHTVTELVRLTDAKLGYTQSDEITLMWPGTSNVDNFWFGGRFQKLVSSLAALATSEFQKAVRVTLPPLYANKEPKFDCRVWQVPNLSEAANNFVWRENDAVKNSISSLAMSVATHKELNKLSQAERLALIEETTGMPWGSQPTWAKRGTYVRKSKIFSVFTADELAALPPKHEAHTIPNLLVERARISEVEMPRLTTVRNKEEMLFNDEPPKFYPILETEGAV